MLQMLRATPAATTHRSPGLGQRLMEWRPVVRIYESRLWRRSALFARATGLSFEEELANIFEAARLDEASRVLDLACGTGIYTRPMAKRLASGRVVGLDLSLPMLDHARALSSQEGVANLDLVRGSALALPFAGAAFDVVNCCGALHLFPDPDLAMREIARVLAPGGRFTVAAIRREEGRWGRRASELRLRVFGVHSFTPGELEGRCADAGLAGFRCHHEHGPWLIASAERQAS